MNSLADEIACSPPPPPLSEAPPYYYSRDSLFDPHNHNQHTPHNSHTTHNSHPVHCNNPHFNHDTNSLNISSDNEPNNDGGHTEEPPPPYSPGLAALFSTAHSQHDVNDAPPSYYSLFGQIREARERSSNSITFLGRVGQIILNTVGCTILLVVFMSVPIAILVIGALFVHNCPVEPFIPIYLIVGGMSGILKNILLIIENIVQRYSDRLAPHVKHTKHIVYVWRAFNLLFNLFMLAWTIAGSYWVYHVYTEVTNSGYSQCIELVYKFAFGIVTSSYILLLLTCMCVCCCAGICLKVNKRTGSREGSRSSGDEDGRLSVRDSEGESEDEERSYRSDEGSRSSVEDFRTNTLVSTLDNHHNAGSDEYLSRFRYLDSTPPISTSGLERAILQYESSPYPSRHREIRHIQHSPFEHAINSTPHTPTPYSASPHNGPRSIQTGSNSNDPIPMNTSIGMSAVDNTIHEDGEGLYITISTEGYSVTEV